LTQCAYRGEIEEVLAMLAAGASVNQNNKNGSTALHLALQQRHADLATLLVTEHQADVNAVTNKFVTPLMVAVTCCMHTGMVQMLLDAGADPLVSAPTRECTIHAQVLVQHCTALQLDQCRAHATQPMLNPRPTLPFFSALFAMHTRTRCTAYRIKRVAITMKMHLFTP
jgi:hypothetical protein